MSERPKTEPEITKEFFEWLGRSISARAHVDDELFRIFAECIGQREQCAIIFYRINSLATRLDLTADIICSYFPKPDAIASKRHKSNGEKALDDIVKNAKDLFSVRTRIAHHHALLRREYSVSLEDNPITLIIKDTYYEIAAEEHESLYKHKKLPNLRIEDLNKHFREIMLLCSAINNFSAHVVSPLLELRRQQALQPSPNPSR